MWNMLDQVAIPDAYMPLVLPQRYWVPRFYTNRTDQYPWYLEQQRGMLQQVRNTPGNNVASKTELFDLWFISVYWDVVYIDSRFTNSIVNNLASNN